MSNESWRDAAQLTDGTKILRSGILYAILLSIIYQAAGYLGPLVGWHRRSTTREWVLVAVIGFALGCLLALRRAANSPSLQSAAIAQSPLEESPHEDGSTR